MDANLFTEFETAAFEAWPVLRAEETYMGWRLRYSGGATRRINCANVTAQSADLGAAHIDEIEARYRQQELPAIFRLTSVLTPPRIDGVLAARGYAHADPAWVMTVPLAQAGGADLPCALDADAWVAAYERIAQTGAAHLPRHLEMIRSGPGASLFAVETIDGVPASCGVGVVRQGKLGVFAVVTAPQHRGKGLAQKLCGGLLRWGGMQGAAHGYLQVAQTNAVALRLYQRLGFAPAYSYWYREAR